MNTRHKLLSSIFVVCLSLYSCTMQPNKQAIEKWKQEILTTEQGFATAVKEEGLNKAFLKYADEDAVLMRSNKLVIGKQSIAQHYKNENSKELTWTPDFVDVSASGDLGYTYGKYTFLYTDANGNTVESKGVFHTVWKRQPDGTWKFVWD